VWGEFQPTVVVQVGLAIMLAIAVLYALYEGYWFG
jgi:hypothetical protein